MVVLHERHQENVVFAADDEDALAGVTAGVRMFQDVEQIRANCLESWDETRTPYRL